MALGFFRGRQSLWCHMPDDFKDYYRKGYGPGSPEHTVLFLCVVALIAGLALAAVWAT